MSTAAELSPTPSCWRPSGTSSPLVDGESEAGVAAPARRGQRARRRVRRGLRRHAGRARRRRPRRGDARAGRRSTSWSARRAPTRRCASPPTPPTPQRGALLQLVQERATEIETKLLFFELEWAALPTSAPRRCSPTTRSSFCAPLPAQRPALPAPPAHRARGEDPGREGDRQLRAPGAGCSASRSRRCASTSDGDELPLDVALSRLQSPDRDAAPRAPPRRSSRRWSPACARAAFIYNTLAPRQGRR